jgi:hypothetical protein
MLIMKVLRRRTNRRKAAPRDQLFYIGKGRGDDTRIDFDGPAPAQALQNTQFEYIQQHGLGFDGQVIDILKVQCTTLRQFKFAGTALGGIHAGILPEHLLDK